MPKLRMIVEVDRVLAKLRSKLAEATAEGNASVVVGYTQSYAIYVHENKEAKHKEGKQEKFLEYPLRVLANIGVFRKILVDAARSGKTFAQALVLCGLRLQRESQLIVPVDTGALKNSAFTTLEVGGPRT